MFGLCYGQVVEPSLISGRIATCIFQLASVIESLGSLRWMALWTFFTAPYLVFLCSLSGLVAWVFALLAGFTGLIPGIDAPAKFCSVHTLSYGGVVELYYIF